MNNDEYITIAAAAEIAGVSTKSIRRYIAAGRITGYRVGPRMIRVNINELQDLLTPIPTTGALETPEQYADRVDRVTNDPRRIEKRKRIAPALTVPRRSGEPA
ncbi:helix-turn-helix domain-containing protein [Arthrobacter sp. efr-133-TYG-118]|uniref:helix-turn-helix domain-containing protein n=1 Tax=Arthrobacter sp. efr-133-TYG-118 TaxID=3040279 RepID=UPI00254DAF98|nr:helix-turn-helix domain-containing protein [Arthrobacter sp. efr-133-TYG-118]